MTEQWDDFWSQPTEAPDNDPHTAIMLARAKEIIWSAENARDRSQQRTPGPSQIGGECARALAYTVLGYKPVNHTSDKWQAHVGTAVHASLAAAYERADNNSGRYLVEHRVSMTTPQGIVVSGSLDIYDRLTGEVIDWKLPGSSSRKKYGRSGPPKGYRIQAHLYAYGLELAGESPKRVANVYLPPEGRLDDAVAWSEAYDRRIAETALRRLENVIITVGGDVRKIKTIPKTITPLCHWCSYWMANSPDTIVGCQGAEGPF